jgi:hypothetical protein
MKSFEDWDKRDGRRGLLNSLTKSLKQKKKEMASHIKTILAGHTQARELCLSILDRTMDFWTFLSRGVSSFYQELLSDKCPDGAVCLKATQQICWKQTTSALRVVFEELQEVRVSASAANLRSGSVRNGAYLHATLQECRILKEFQDADFQNHDKIRFQGLGEVYKNYVSKDELAAASLLATSLKTAHTGLEGRLKKQEEKMESLTVKIKNNGESINNLRNRGGGGAGRGGGNP